MEKQSIDPTIEAAATSQSDKDYEAFFNNVRRKELFFNISNPSDFENKDEIRVPTVSVGDGLNAVVFYTSPNDKRLSDKYAGIVWEKGLEMVSKMSNVNGLVVQSASDHWIAITKDKIEEILSQFKAKK